MTDPAAIDPDELPDLTQRLHDRVQWEKTGHDHDLFKEALAAVDALRGRVFIADTEVTRLQTANAHWHLRVSQMKTDAEAAAKEVEALRERVAEMLDGEMKLSRRAEASEAQVVELAGALGGLLDSVRAHNDANDREMVDPHATGAARTALAILPAKALERAKATQDIIDIAREIVSMESAWTSEWVAKDRLLHNKFAILDALNQEGGA